MVDAAEVGIKVDKGGPGAVVDPGPHSLVFQVDVNIKVVPRCQLGIGDEWEGPPSGPHAVKKNKVAARSAHDDKDGPEGGVGAHHQAIAAVHPQVKAYGGEAGRVGDGFNRPADIGRARYGFADVLIGGAGRGARAPDRLPAFAHDLVLDREVRGCGRTENPAVLAFERAESQISEGIASPR